MSLRSFSLLTLLLWIFLLGSPLHSQAPDAWSAPAFSVPAEGLLKAASLVKPDKDLPATVLLSETLYNFDRQGTRTERFHLIYRIENEDGVKNWAETNYQWEPWHESKPEIRARVITADGAVHNLDPKTLTDIPVHEDSPDTFTDERAFGGPLPAIAENAIVEEEGMIRDTAPFFAGGIAERLLLNKSVRVNKTRVLINYPDSLPFHYQIKEMPGARITKSVQSGIVSVAIEDGPYQAREQKLSNLPADVPRGPEVEFSTGTSWGQIASEYVRLSNGKMRTADVQPLIAKISPKGGTRQEIIRRMIAVLHKNVRYTGIEFGESSLVPQFPAETLKRKYGDCKDKATLLVTMLRAIYIPASLALLSSSPGEDVNPDLPGMGMFDHAIVYVPAEGTTQEMWIDATAQYTRVGDLPEMDYGRWALIIDEKTSSLTKIPELTAAANFHREIREFTLAEFGPATIKETDEQIGPREADYRSYYNGDTKEVRENSENYVKRAYLADSLTSLEHGNVSDLEKPFSVTFVTKGKRGTTDFESAVMAIRLEDLADDFPKYFTTSPKEEVEEQKEEQQTKKTTPRTADWQINPFITEWDYKIVAPPGFKLRSLPPIKEEQLGVAKFTQKYKANAEANVVEAVLRLENPKSRLTVKEAESLRDAVIKLRDADPIFVTFDQTAHALISAGKIKEGLAAYQDLVRQHPKEALHRIQLSRALLMLGLGERARVMAREATSLEPNSAQAYSNLGWVLEHDLIGRQRNKGMDLTGAISAYRKARELDPRNSETRVSLASLLEYDANGERYSEDAALKQAAAEFKELKKIDEDAWHRHEDFILYDLWYAHDFSALKQELDLLPSTDTRRGFAVALAAVDKGTEAALSKAIEITTSEELRKKALTNAGWLLLRLRRYSEAADLLAGGARGERTETQTTTFANTLKKTRRRDEIRREDGSPIGVIQRFFAAVFQTHPDLEQALGFMSHNALRSKETSDQAEFSRSMFQLRRQMEKNGVSLEIAGDIVLSNAKYTVEGNDEQGYRVTLETPGAPAQQAFVIRENGTYKLLEFAFANNNLPEHLGWQALELVRRNDLAGARKWLDWAREEIHMSASDDPLGAQPFPYFWSKGQEGDADAIRTAALVLVPSRELQGDDLKALIETREKVKSDQDKARIDFVVTSAYSKQQRWAEMSPFAVRLVQEFPDSMTAFRMMTTVYARTLQFSEWDRVLNERLAKYPDDLDYIRSAAELARYRKDFAKSREYMKKVMERSRATANDLNLYAWDALFLGEEIGQDSIEAAERANQLTQNANFSIMHTLACIYTHTGKASQARELILKGMEGKLEEPDSAIWLAYGQVAEAYGELEAARNMYARVEKSEIESPGSNYGLAQKRLIALRGSPVTSARSENR